MQISDKESDNSGKKTKQSTPKGNMNNHEARLQHILTLGSVVMYPWNSDILRVGIRMMGNFQHNPDAEP